MLIYQFLLLQLRKTEKARKRAEAVMAKDLRKDLRKKPTGNISCISL